jgi:hypothetical protein
MASPTPATVRTLRDRLEPALVESPDHVVGELVARQHVSWDAVPAQTIVEPRDTV